MWQKEKKDSSVVSLALLLALATTSMAASLFVSDVMLAQSPADVPSFPLPKTVESGTTVRIDGSSSMATINQNLKDRFEKQFSGTKVEVAANGTDAALKALLDGKVDLAAIGRGLTPQEKAQGLEQVRLRREKIAIAVGEENPFQGSLTSKQFAQIFRGEITDWSQVGGAPGKIRVIDRPQTSDTRESFRGYPVFRSANFATGSTASQLVEDNSAEAIKQLGKDGITYVIANQVSKLQGVRVLPMHKTLPDDAKYPFSQPLVYVYKKNPSPATAGFLGFSTAAPGQQAIEEARAAEAAAVAQGLSQTSASTTASTATGTTPSAVASPRTETTPSAVATPDVAASPLTETAPGAQTTTNTNATNAADTFVPTSNGNANASNTIEGGISPWWWLLVLPVIGAALCWLTKRRRSRSDDNSNILEPTPTQPSKEGLTTAALGASTPSTVGNLADSTAQTTSNLAENTNTSVSNVAGNLSSTGGAVSGAAIAAGAGGIWSAASNKNSETETPLDTSQIGNIEDTAPSEPGEDVWDVEAPITVVNPSYPDLPDAAEDVWNDAEATDMEPPAQSNWGGAASSAMWSRVSGGNSQESEVSDTTEVTSDLELPALELPRVTEVTKITAAAPDASDMPPVPYDEEEDWADLTEEEPAQSNWLDNITNTGGAALAGGTALAAGAGAALWSRFAGGDREEAEVTNETPEDSNVEEDVWDIETPPTEPTNLVTRLPNVSAETSNLELPVVEITLPGSELPSTSTASDRELPVVEIIPPSQLPDASEETFNIEAPTIEITNNQTQEEQPAQSNWLENITPAGGAAAAAAAASSALWARFAGGSQQAEVTNNTPEDSDAEGDVWDIETPPSEVTIPVLAADLNVEAPFVELPEVPEVTSNVVSVTEIPPNSELPDFPEVTSDLQQPATEVTTSALELSEVPEVASQINWGDLAEDNDDELAQSNWLENITSSGSADLAGGTSSVMGSELSGDFPESEVINETASDSDNNENDWDIETPPTEVTIPVTAADLNVEAPTAVVDQEDWGDLVEEEQPVQSNWLENITSSGSADLAGGTSSVMGSELSGDFPESEVINETASDSDNNENDWDIETLPTEVTIPVTAADLNVEAPTAVVDQEDWGDLVEEEQPVQSNWLENITSGVGAAIAGGTALAAGAASSAMLSGLSGEGSEVVTNETTEVSDNHGNDWDVETPPAEVTIPVLVQPNVTGGELKPARTGGLENVAPITDADWEEPTTEVTDVTFIQPDVTAVQFNVEAPFAGQPTTEVRETTEEEPDDTVVELKPARTGELENVAPITSVEQPTTEVTATTGVPNVTAAELHVEAPKDESTTPVTELQDVTAAQLHIEAPATELSEVSEASQPTVQQTEEVTPPVSNPPEETTPGTNAAAWGGAAAAAAAGIASLNSISGNHENTEVYARQGIDYTEENAAAMETDAGSSIVLTPRTPKWAYVSWELSDTEKETLRQQGGSQLAVRLYDVTDIDLSYQTPQLVQQYECDEATSDRFVAIPASDRDYMAEVGYIASEEGWLLLARSATVRVFSRLEADFWFVTDTELIVHGATEPGSTVTVAGSPIKVKPDGTFHLRIPFTNDLIDYVMVAISADKQKNKIIHKKFIQENPEG